MKTAISLPERMVVEQGEVWWADLGDPFPRSPEAADDLEGIARYIARDSAA